MNQYHAENVACTWTYPFGTNTYTLGADTTAKLYTGGKAKVNRQNLFCITASAGEYPKLPASWQYAPSTAIDPTTLLVAGEHPDSDGKVWKVLADNSTEDLTIHAPGHQHYHAEVGQQKYKSYFEVFVDQPDPTGTRVWTHADSGGHAWWRLRTDAPNEAINRFIPSQLIPFLGVSVGYAPTNTATVNLVFPNAPGELRYPETDFYFSAYGKYKIGIPNLIAALGVTKHLYDYPGGYGLKTFNCVDAVIVTSIAAGKSLPNDKGPHSYSNPEYFGKGLPPSN